MQDKDFEWFIDNYESIYKKYGHCFVVIKNKKVLGSYAKYTDGVKAALKNNKLGTFIVQKLCENKSDAINCYISSLSF